MGIFYKYDTVDDVKHNPIMSLQGVLRESNSRLSQKVRIIPLVTKLNTRIDSLTQNKNQDKLVIVENIPVEAQKYSNRKDISKQVPHPSVRFCLVISKYCHHSKSKRLIDEG